MNCVKVLYKKYEPLSSRNKMLGLLNSVYRLVTRDVSLCKKMVDVQGKCENIYRAEVLANKDPALRAKSLLTLWRNSNESADALKYRDVDFRS